MGEMKVEHVLLFLVGAFLVYHMMGKCRCKEGISAKEARYDINEAFILMNPQGYFRDDIIDAVNSIWT